MTGRLSGVVDGDGAAPTLRGRAADDVDAHDCRVFGAWHRGHQ
jgi:hypothetical protein